MRRCRLTLEVLAVGAIALALVGCVNITSPRGPAERVRNVGAADAWPISNDVMQAEDKWFQVGGTGKGTIKGYASGEAQTTDGGPGTFVLTVVEDSPGVPVRHLVQIDYGRYTPVFIDGEQSGTVGEGILDPRNHYDVTTGGRPLTIEFEVEEGRLRARRVIVGDHDPQ